MTEIFESEVYKNNDGFHSDYAEEGDIQIEENKACSEGEDDHTFWCQFERQNKNPQGQLVPKT